MTMKRSHRKSRVALLACLGFFAVTFLSGAYVLPQDRKYVDYFLRLHAAELFRTQAYVLDKSWSYVSQRRLEKVEMRFSCYKVLTVNQARKVIVGLATELLNKINSDTAMKTKHLVTEPFTIDRIKIEVRTDNVLSKNADSASVRTVLLSDNEIIYETYPPSTLFSGYSRTYKETFEYALMLLDDPALLEQAEHDLRSQLTEKPWKGKVFPPETPFFRFPVEGALRLPVSSEQFVQKPIVTYGQQLPLENRTFAGNPVPVAPLAWQSSSDVYQKKLAPIGEMPVIKESFPERLLADVKEPFLRFDSFHAHSFQKQPAVPISQDRAIVDTPVTTYPPCPRESFLTKFVDFCEQTKGVYKGETQELGRESFPFVSRELPQDKEGILDQLIDFSPQTSGNAQHTETILGSTQFPHIVSCRDQQTVFDTLIAFEHNPKTLPLMVDAPLHAMKFPESSPSSNQDTLGALIAFSNTDSTDGIDRSVIVKTDVAKQAFPEKPLYVIPRWSATNSLLETEGGLPPLKYTILATSSFISIRDKQHCKECVVTQSDLDRASKMPEKDTCISMTAISLPTDGIQYSETPSVFAVQELVEETGHRPDKVTMDENVKEFFAPCPTTNQHMTCVQKNNMESRGSTTTIGMHDRLLNDTSEGFYTQPVQPTLVVSAPETHCVQDEYPIDVSNDILCQEKATEDDQFVEQEVMEASGDPQVRSLEILPVAEPMVSQNVPEVSSCAESGDSLVTQCVEEPDVFEEHFANVAVNQEELQGDREEGSSSVMPDEHLNFLVEQQVKSLQNGVRTFVTKSASDLLFESSQVIPLDVLLAQEKAFAEKEAATSDEEQ